MAGRHRACHGSGELAAREGRTASQPLATGEGRVNGHGRARRCAPRARREAPPRAGPSSRERTGQRPSRIVRAAARAILRGRLHAPPISHDRRSRGVPPGLRTDPTREAPPSRAAAVMPCDSPESHDEHPARAGRRPPWRARHRPLGSMALAAHVDPPRPLGGGRGAKRRRSAAPVPPQEDCRPRRPSPADPVWTDRGGENGRARARLERGLRAFAP